MQRQLHITINSKGSDYLFWRDYQVNLLEDCKTRNTKMKGDYSSNFSYSFCKKLKRKKEDSKLQNYLAHDKLPFT